MSICWQMTQDKLFLPIKVFNPGLKLLLHYACYAHAIELVTRVLRG